MADLAPRGTDALQAGSGEGPDALAVSGLTHRIGGRVILDQVEFVVPAGRLVTLLGPNGAGKTTLLSLVTRLYTAQQGEIRVFGHDVRKESSAALSQMGVVFQQRAIDPDLTARQNLAYHAALHGLSPRRARDRIAAELGRMGLTKDADRKIRTLSGGESRRIEIARALLHDPRLLLCDEATVGLDLRSRADILADIRGLVRERGVAVLWATHLIDEVEAEDLVVVLHRGRVLRQGRARDIVAALGADGLNDAFRRITEAAA
ncbi:MAG: ATP-binding cassette domain-containing protein [Rhodospirillaceae bacterium]|jgi:ABC-2 type transport system ATP-binding protein|nr:ATP-binding cassette domain-containing protein [Rhodospirillaceae bacterium]